MHSYRLRNGTGKYCGRACYMAARWGGTGQCRQCGEDCATQFCSPVCSKAYWNKNGAAVHKHPRNWRRKLALIESLGGKCIICGFADIRALDINHKNPTTKVRPKTGYTWGRRFRDWEANAGNLELLCANCHRLHTWEQRGFGRGIVMANEEV